MHAPQRTGLEPAPRFELAHEFVEVLLEVALKHLHADFVDTGCAAVTFHRFESLHHELGSDPARQRVDFAFLHWYAFGLCSPPAQVPGLLGTVS